MLRLMSWLLLFHCALLRSPPTTQYVVWCSAVTMEISPQPLIRYQCCVSRHLFLSYRTSLKTVSYTKPFWLVRMGTYLPPRVHVYSIIVLALKTASCFPKEEPGNPNGIFWSQKIQWEHAPAPTPLPPSPVVGTYWCTTMQDASSVQEIPSLYSYTLSLDHSLIASCCPTVVLRIPIAILGSIGKGKRWLSMV